MSLSHLCRVLVFALTVGAILFTTPFAAQAGPFAMQARPFAAQARPFAAQAQGTAAAGPLASVEMGSYEMLFQPLAPVGGLELTLGGPDDFYLRQRFPAGSVATIDPSGLADGVYTWQLKALPRSQTQPSSEARERVRRAGDPASAEPLRQRAQPPVFEPLSGSFSVRGGALVDPSLPETPTTPPSIGTPDSQAPEADGLSNLTGAYYVNNNLYVNNSACIGSGCPSSGEPFGSDTIRLRANNLRIHFEDNSTSGSYPSQDWRILINDQENGGLDRFSIEDVTANDIPFTIEGGAADHALYVESDGNVGLGTNEPATSLHITRGDSPALRLEQDSSEAFTPYIWDVVGNEVNFAIRDASGGFFLPFRIEGGSPQNSLFVEDDGDIGLGTSAPEAGVRLHIQANEDSNFAGLRVENEGTGNIQTHFVSTDGDGWEWRQTFREGDMILDSQEDGTNEWEVDTGGNVTATSFNPTSDRNAKENFGAVEPSEVLERLARIPVQRWNYISDSGDTPHLGVMAQDFHAAFGVGMDDKHIATTDADGVAFAAIQALYQQLQETRSELEKLRAETVQGCEP